MTIKTDLRTGTRGTLVRQNLVYIDSVDRFTHDPEASPTSRTSSSLHCPEQ
jgi:hypothetical protein